VYALCDPVTFEPRYIGKSINCEKRYWEHINGAQKANHHNQYLARVLKKMDWKPRLLILEHGLPESELLALEMDWIAYGRRVGWRLTNMTEGGEGVSGAKPTALTRAKIGAGNRGKKMSDEAKAKLREAHLGMKASDAARAKMSASRTGIKHTAQARANMSAAQQARVVSEEVRAAASAKQRAAWVLRRERGVSDVTRARMSASQKARTDRPPGEPWSPERHAKYGEEEKAKRSEAQRLRWQDWREENGIPDTISREELIRLYVDEAFSLKEIGVLCGRGGNWVGSQLKRYGIPTSVGRTNAQKEIAKARRQNESIKGK
jgi:hypothetical protein